MISEFGLLGLRSVLFKFPLAVELSDNVNDQVPEETTSNLKLTSSPKHIGFLPIGLGESVKVAVGLWLTVIATSFELLQPVAVMVSVNV